MVDTVGGGQTLVDTKESRPVPPDSQCGHTANVPTFDFRAIIDEAPSKSLTLVTSCRGQGASFTWPQPTQRDCSRWAANRSGLPHGYTCHLPKQGLCGWQTRDLAPSPPRRRKTPFAAESAIASPVAPRTATGRTASAAFRWAPSPLALPRWR